MKLEPHIRILNYLKKELIKHNNFKEFGENSLIFNGEVDKILIYINSCNLTIIHDGLNVNHGIEMIQILDSIDEDDSAINEVYLQPILHKF